MMAPPDIKRCALSGFFLQQMICRVKGLLMAFMALLCLMPVEGSLANPPRDWEAYGPLLDYIRMENRSDPLVEFVRTGDAVDQTLSLENRQFISQNTNLLERIKGHLHSDDLNWQLRRASQRVMVVPEKRPEYAALFESYCRTVIEHILAKTALPNPYGTIATLGAPPGDPIPSGENGITAYLVHNIADVYTEEYVFFDGRDQNRKVSIKLDNRVYRGEVGSYSSYLVIEGDRRYTFERNAYTLWRNSATNPVNVLIAPVEETLHIALRDATQTAIQMQLAEQPPTVLADIEAVVDEWLAVEEAVVGGLVNELMPEILARFLETDTADIITRSLADRQLLSKYRYLDQGIELVRRMGLQPAIRTYLDHPRRFEALLLPAPTAMAQPAASADSDPQDDSPAPANAAAGQRGFASAG